MTTISKVNIWHTTHVKTVIQKAVIPGTVYIYK